MSSAADSRELEKQHTERIFRNFQFFVDVSVEVPQFTRVWTKLHSWGFLHSYILLQLGCNCSNSVRKQKTFPWKKTEEEEVFNQKWRWWRKNFNFELKLEEDSVKKTFNFCQKNCLIFKLFRVCALYFRPHPDQHLTTILSIYCVFPCWKTSPNCHRILIVIFSILFAHCIFSRRRLGRKVGIGATRRRRVRNDVYRSFI